MNICISLVIVIVVVVLGRLLIYPEDVHAIDRPATEAEQWVAIAEWIKEHL